MADSVTRSSRPEKTRKELKSFRLDPDRIRAAQRALGTATATETIETALDMVVFRQELLDGLAAMRGVDIISPDEEV
jgi:hypothetical protein